MSGMQRGAEGSLADLWQALADGRRWIAVGALMGLVVGAAALAIMPMRYEAVVLLKLGPGEPSGQAVERIMGRAFQDIVLGKLDWTDARAGLYRASIRAAPSGAMVELRLRAQDPHDAEHAITATVDQLSLVHQELALSTPEGSEAAVAEIANEIRETETLLARLNSLRKDIPTSNFRDTLSMFRLTTDERNRLRHLRHQLASASSRTAAIAPPSVTPAPVFPRPWQALALGLLGGTVLGAMGVILRGSNPAASLQRST